MMDCTKPCKYWFMLVICLSRIFALMQVTSTKITRIKASWQQPGIAIWQIFILRKAKCKNLTEGYTNFKSILSPKNTNFTEIFGNFPDNLETKNLTLWKVSGHSGFQALQKVSRYSTNLIIALDSLPTIWKDSGHSGKFPDTMEML